MSIEACCTCALLLPSTGPSYDFSTEKRLQSEPPRRLPCCQRAICASCISGNPRFINYCPFCQVSSGPSPLPQGLRDPPAYTSPPSSPSRHPVHVIEDEPPAYSSLDTLHQASKLNNSTTPDVIHHLHPTDTLPSLSLLYAVPAPVLRQHNALFSNHLLSARRTLSIPGSHYKGGVSLSPDPVEGEEERERKSKVRKFMVAVKCHQYDVAELYLKQAEGILLEAVERWKEDEKWERENPFDGKGKGKVGKRRVGAGAGLTGQLS